MCVATTMFLQVFLFSSFIAAWTDSVLVKQGHLRGHRLVSKGGREIFAFQGVPYAKPPIGELRFKPPQPPDSWKGILDATQDGPMCIQRPGLSTDPNTPLLGGEDCLYLNVFTPRLPEEHPVSMDVMFFIHGGGWMTGSGGSTMHGPQYLLDKDVVLVSVNYRLGAFGFLSTGDAACPGNNGLKDLVAALRWVQDNIAAFGGNPGSVTIFGHSAGAVNVHFLMLSPVSNGLFHRAISQSGTALAPWALSPPGLMKQYSRMLAASLACPIAPSIEMLACLRHRDAEDIIYSAPPFYDGDDNPLVTFRPVVETSTVDDHEAIITSHPVQALLNTSQHHVPWMTGLSSADGAIITASTFVRDDAIRRYDEKFDDIIAHRFLVHSRKSVPEKMEVAKRIREYYFGGRPMSKELERAAGDIYTDAMVLLPSDLSLKYHLHRGSKAYFYYFDYRGTNSFCSLIADPTEDQGVCHMDEMLYLFPQDLLFPNSTRTDADDLMVDTLTALWTDFARTGSSSSPPLSCCWPLPSWPESPP
ncbi:esterase FE4-like isoform X2 [Periplaneta americana]|uniref:esterase FE4-like isoform X2 n=1 Tax=Periplaneta americana TaxID=6978 RepID=UPI0037E6F9C9